MGRAARGREPPFPRVRFEPGFVRRVERSSARLSAARERREAIGTQTGGVGGFEFVGYRAYTAGDDPRAIDWSALARFDRALVRLTRAEAGERWSIVIDTSASMGVGPPGKLQRACECAAGVVALALRSSARAHVIAVSRASTTSLDFDRRARFADLLSFLEGLEARGSASAADLARVAPMIKRSQRVFVLSDLLSFVPHDIVGLKNARRAVHALRILAPLELFASDGAVEWFDPEDGDALSLEIEGRARGGYERELGLELEHWRGACARAGVRASTSTSASSFEEILEKALAP